MCSKLSIFQAKIRGQCERLIFGKQRVRVYLGIKPILNYLFVYCITLIIILLRTKFKLKTISHNIISSDNKMYTYMYMYIRYYI